MAATQEPRNNIYYNWALGESGWNSQNDANLLKLATFTGLSVLDRDLTTPPGSPANGDTYIVATGGTGAWAAKDAQLAVWRSGAAAWEFYDPSLTKARLLVFIEDESRLGVWNGTNWALGVALT